MFSSSSQSSKAKERKTEFRETDFSAKIRCLFRRHLVLLFGLFRDLIKYLPDESLHSNIHIPGSLNRIIQLQNFFTGQTSMDNEANLEKTCSEHMTTHTIRKIILIENDITNIGLKNIVT